MLHFSVDKLEVDFDADLLEEDGHRRLPAQAEHLPRVGDLELSEMEQNSIKVHKVAPPLKSWGNFLSDVSSSSSQLY